MADRAPVVGLVVAARWKEPVATRKGLGNGGPLTMIAGARHAEQILESLERYCSHISGGGH